MLSIDFLANGFTCDLVLSIGLSHILWTQRVHSDTRKDTWAIRKMANSYFILIKCLTVSRYSNYDDGTPNTFSYKQTNSARERENFIVANESMWEFLFPFECHGYWIMSQVLSLLVTFLHSFCMKKKYVCHRIQRCMYHFKWDSFDIV